MSTLGTVAFAENYDHLEVEQRLRTSWDRLKLYEFDPYSGKPVYSIDTPPPYVSAAQMDTDEIVALPELRAWLELFALASYQSTGYRRVKNPRIWSLHDLAALTEPR